LRVAEDLRFFHQHLSTMGKLLLLRTAVPMVIYRHRPGQSQSSQTSRKLLLHLRVLALERAVLKHWDQFCVWGAGRDGKDLLKALSAEVRSRILCMVDVDDKKIEAGYYVNRELNARIPILHFSSLAKDPAIRARLYEQWKNGQSRNQPGFGRINKSRGGLQEELESSPKKNPRMASGQGCDSTLDLGLLPNLPVVVCVSLYRTNGALEHNVQQIGRTEGSDLWHFS
jgi:hypothetical protein